MDAINALGTDGIVINFTGFDLNSLLQDEEKTAGNDTAATVQASEETVQETVREESGTEEKD